MFMVDLVETQTPHIEWQRIKMEQSTRKRDGVGEVEMDQTNRMFKIQPVIRDSQTDLPF